jgi:hypothetical protein
MVILLTKVEAVIPVNPPQISLDPKSVDELP